MPTMPMHEVIVPRSYHQRVEESIIGVFVGLFLLITVPIFLWLVERQIARYALMLKRCRIATREMPVCDIASPDNTGRPILVKGYTRRCGDDESLADADTGYRGPDMSTIHRPVKKEVIRLMRRVEMYQWVELQSMEENRTVYTYTQRWSQYDQNSRMFQRPDEHENPPSRVPPLYSTSQNAKDVAIGVYLCNDTQVTMLTTWEPCHINELPNEVNSWTDMLGNSLGAHLETSTEPTTDIFEVAASLSPSLMGSFASSASLTFTDVVVDTKPHHKRPKLPTDYIVVNGNLTLPKIGTVRICYYMVLSGGPVSTVAVQMPLQKVNPSNFTPFEHDDGGSLDFKQQEWEEGKMSIENEETSGEGRVVDQSAESCIRAGVRTPSLPVQYTFRPFTEADAQRTMTWSVLCCGAQDDHEGTGPYGKYVYAPHSGSFVSKNVSTPPLMTSINNSSGSLSTTVSGSKPFPQQSRHEYQSLDSVHETPTMSPVCCNMMECDPCCPVINYCVGEIVGTEVILLEERFVSKEKLFKHKLDEFHWKVMMTRIASYLMLSLAFLLILKPIASLLSFLPFIGTLLLNFFWVASLLSGFVLGVFISAAAWVLYRPQLLTGLFIVFGMLLQFIERHPEDHAQREVSQTLKITGTVLLVLSLLPLSLSIYQMIEEYRFRRLQTMLDDNHNQHTHRHNTNMTYSKRSPMEVNAARYRDSQQLAQFSDAGEKLRDAKDGEYNRRGQWTRQPSSASATSSLSAGFHDEGGGHIATEETHLLARNGLSDDIHDHEGDRGTWGNV